MNTLLFICFHIAFTIPASGMNVSLGRKQVIPSRKWTLISEWSTIDKIQDFQIYEKSVFQIPRSGIYFMLIHLYYEKIENITLYIKLTQNGDQRHIGKYRIYENLDDILLNEIYAANKNTNISIELYTDNNYINILCSTSISFQFIHAFEQSVGFIASPQETALLSQQRKQYLLNWIVDFNIFRGFSSSSGLFTVILDGYYIINVKLILENISGNIDVYLNVNGESSLAFRNYYKSLLRYDTVSFSDVLKLQKKNKLYLQISSNSKGKVLKQSRYSIIFMKPNSLASYFRKNIKVAESIESNNWHPVINWLTTESLRGIQIQRYSYYYVLASLDVECKNTTVLESRLAVNNIPRITKRQYTATGLNKVVLSGLFFMNEGQRINCDIKSHKGTILQNTSFISIMPMFYFNHSSMYISTNNISLFYQQSRTNMEIKPLFDVTQVFVKWLGIGNNIFSPTKEDASQSIVIKRTGTFLITLNLNISNATDRGSVAHLLLKRKELNWTVIRRLNIDYSKSVFYTCLISLKTGDSISLLRNITSDSLISSIEIQYLISSKQSKGGTFSINITREKDKKKLSHSFIPTSVLMNICKTVKSQDGNIKIEHSGTYMIILNLDFSQATPKKKFIVSLFLRKNKKERKIYEMKKKNAGATSLTFYINCLQYLESGDEFYFSLNQKSTLQLTNSDISFLLIGSDKGKLLSRKASSGSVESGKINWGEDLENPWFNVFVDVTTKKTFFCLLSTVITGEIAFESDEEQFIQVNVKLNEEKIHHLQVRHSNFSHRELVSLTLSGMITLHEQDKLTVYIELSSGARIKLSRHVKFQLAVLDQFYSGVDDISVLHPAVLESSTLSTGNLSLKYLSFTTLCEIQQFHLISWCGNFVERHSFGRFARNCAETVPFRKISTVRN